MSDDGDDVVWFNTVDGGTWACKVVRTGPYNGALTIADAEGTVVHSEPVVLSYGAIFGPDVADVNLWCDRSIEVIDNPEARVLS